MKWALRELLILAPLLQMTCLLASGQSQPNSPPPVRARVYVTEFKPSGTSRNDLSQFARQLFKLGFWAIPGVDVAGDSESPPCGPSLDAPVGSSTQGHVTPDHNPKPSSVPVFYTVQGTVDEHDAGSPAVAQNQSNILLAYELIKTRNCQATSLFRRTRTFSMADALQSLEAATEELSLQLSDDAADKAAVEVDTVEALGDAKGTYKTGDLLTRFIRQKVADSDALRLWDPDSAGKPRYKLTGCVRFSEAESAGVIAEVEFFANGNPLPVNFPARTISPTSEALIPLYLDAANAAVKGLSDVLYKERAGLNQISPQGPEALVQKAKQLLCVEAATDSQRCSPDPQAAILALDEAQQDANLANRAEVMALVGRADFLNQQYPAAGEAYDAALKSAGTGSAEAKLTLLKSAADAWYEAKEYVKAAERYRQCLPKATANQPADTPLPLQQEVRVKLVHSLVLADQPAAGLDALLDGLNAVHRWPNPDDASKALYNSLSSELTAVLNGLPGEKLKSAVEKLEKELGYDPGLQAAALNQIGLAYGAKGQYDESIPLYRKAVSLKPDYGDAHFNLGFALTHQGQTSEAIPEYRKVLEVNPSDAAAHNNLGTSLCIMGRCKEAIDEYRRAISLKPDYAEAYNNLGGTLFDMGQIGEAESLYKQAIRTQPNDTQAYYNLWWLYRRFSRRKDAEEIFSNLQKIAPAGDLYAQLILAQVRDDEEDFTGAAEVYSALLKQYPEEPNYVVQLAAEEIKAGMKNHDQPLIQTAIHRLEQEVAKSPAFMTCFQLAWAYQIVPELGDPEKAEQLYKRALHYKPNDVQTLDNMAALTLLKGDFQGVIAEARQVLEVNPGDVDALENLGYGLFLTGDLQGAIQVYKKALALSPDDPTIRICHGEALLWSGDAASAHGEFAQARDLLSSPGYSGGTWIWLIDARYDPTDKQRAVYYSTLQQKQALAELLDGLTYLRDSKIELTLERYGVATRLLSGTIEEDKEIVRKGINDLHRLGKNSLAQTAAELGLGYLYDWLGEREHAATHWESYVRLGTDPAGLEEARSRLAQKLR
jgi:tetratricopeptide (TPR) repeat protein